MPVAFLLHLACQADHFQGGGVDGGDAPLVVGTHDPGGDPAQHRLHVKPPILQLRVGVPEGLLAAFVQFRNDLAARGADLVLLPLAPTPFFETHRLFDGVDAKTEIYPGWTRMMIQLLEADIEVIDTVDEFRSGAGNWAPP